MKETVKNGEVEVTQTFLRSKDDYLQEQKVLLADVTSLQEKIDEKNARLAVVNNLLSQL